MRGIRSQYDGVERKLNNHACTFTCVHESGVCEWVLRGNTY